MKSLLWKLLADEAGVVLSSEIALVGTVGVLGMVVGLEAVTSSVTSELNDLASAFGTISQSYNYRSISKPGHAWVSGSGFNDRGDYCDCEAITQTVVSGKFDAGSATEDAVSRSSVSQSTVVSSAPVVREQIIEERVIDEVIVEPCPDKAIAPVCPDDEIIEEHIIIRRRPRTDGDCAATTRFAPTPTVIKPQLSKPQFTKPQIAKPQPVTPQPRLKPEPDKIEAKPRKKG